MEAALSRAAADIRGAAGHRAPDWARAYAVVEYAVRRWRYSEDGVWSYTAYGALVDHAAVCMGISLATLLLMERMGVPCRYLHGYRREGDTVGHGWNLIYCGGWFHLDVTDAVTSRDPLQFWGVTALTDRSLEPGLTLPGPLRCRGGRIYGMERIHILTEPTVTVTAISYHNLISLDYVVRSTNIIFRPLPNGEESQHNAFIRRGILIIYRRRYIRIVCMVLLISPRTKPECTQ